MCRNVQHPLHGLLSFHTFLKILHCRTERETTESMQTDEPVEVLEHDCCAGAEPAALDLSPDHAEEIKVGVAGIQKQVQELQLIWNRSQSPH